MYLPPNNSYLNPIEFFIKDFKEPLKHNLTLNKFYYYYYYYYLFYNSLFIYIREKLPQEIINSILQINGKCNFLKYFVQSLKYFKECLQLNDINY